MLAPMQRIRDYAGGVWARLEVPPGQSLRLRFANVRGDGPQLSAIMWD